MQYPSCDGCSRHCAILGIVGSADYKVILWLFAIEKCDDAVWICFENFMIHRLFGTFILCFLSEKVVIFHKMYYINTSLYNLHRLNYVNNITR